MSRRQVIAWVLVIFWVAVFVAALFGLVTTWLLRDDRALETAQLAVVLAVGLYASNALDDVKAAS